MADNLGMHVSRSIAEVERFVAAASFPQCLNADDVAAKGPPAAEACL
jgi:Zn ribbon nucleic-acid-binding protein